MGPFWRPGAPIWRISWIFVILGALRPRIPSPFWAPCWAQVGAKFELSWAIVIQKVFRNTLGKRFASKHRFLKKFCFPGVSPDMKKQAKPQYCCSFSGFPPKWKKLLWRGVWGSILGAFWVPSWAMLGTELA